MVMDERDSLEIDDKFRALVETTPDTILIADQTSRIIFCNNKVRHIFGYTPQEIHHQPITMLVPVSHRAALQAEIDQFVQTKRNSFTRPTTQMLGLHKDGTVVPTELSLSFWYQSHRIYFSVIIRDISERKKNEEALEKEREYLQAILDSAEEAIIGCDENGVINFFNQAAREKHGVDSQALPPENWAEYYNLYYPDSNTLMRKEDIPLFRALRGEVVHNVETMIIPPGGPRCYMVCNGRQVVCRDGKILGAVVVVHDVTSWRNITAALIDKNRLILHAFNDLKNAEKQLIVANNELENRVNRRTEQLSVKNEELNYYNEALQKANTDLDNFLYIASHDLKVPLINMEQLLKFLSLDLTDKSEGVSDLLEKLSLSVTRMKKTILAIAEVAKVQKQVQYQREKINLVEVCTEITDSIAEQIKSESAHIECDFTEVDSLEFSFINLKSILYNLISNAIKYKSSERAPYIQISSHDLPGYIALRVKDNGLGMDLNKNGSKLFGMFSRLHDHVEGSGIGLYVIKRIIENAGGYIEVNSKPGEGSEFTVYFRNPASTPSAS